MPSYNYARFLRTAVVSVLEQSYEAFELLIVDNGSSDGSYEIACEYAELDARVRVLTHARRENRGVNASLNLGLEEARGVYFGLLPADDVYLPESLGRRVTQLEAQPEVGFVYGTAQILDEAARPIGRLGGQAPEDMLRYDATDDLLQALLFHDFVPGAALFARRGALLDIWGFDEAVFFNDWYITIRLLARAPCAFLPGAPLVGYRLHERHRDEENLAADRPRKLELFRALWRHADSAGDRLQEPRVRALIALQRAVHASRLGEVEEARASVADAIAADRSLRTDGAFVSWWLDPCHGEWSLAIAEDARRDFLAALAAPWASVEEVLAAGPDYTAFVLLVLQAADDTWGSEARSQIAWTVVAQQLEAVGGRAHPWVLFSTLLRAFRRPGLLRLRPFVKVLLCAAGLWSFAAKARRSGSAFAR
jgi:glycosyltransferase involved in cell wall biosynthesis